MSILRETVLIKKILFMYINLDFMYCAFVCGRLKESQLCLMAALVKEFEL